MHTKPATSTKKRAKEMRWILMFIIARAWLEVLDAGVSVPVVGVMVI